MQLGKKMAQAQAPHSGEILRSLAFILVNDCHIEVKGAVGVSASPKDTKMPTLGARLKLQAPADKKINTVVLNR